MRLPRVSSLKSISIFCLEDRATPKIKRLFAVFLKRHQFEQAFLEPFFLVSVHGDQCVTRPDERVEFCEQFRFA